MDEKTIVLGQNSMANWLITFVLPGPLGSLLTCMEVM